MNKRIESIPPSVTLSITGKAKAMKAAGESVCSFAAGEPDFDTPEHIKAAAQAALAAGETKYAPVAGLQALREAIAAKLQDQNKLPYTAQQVVVSNGGKHSLFNIIMAICGEGDEVIIPSPFWLSYPEMVKIAGGTPVYVEASEESGYKMSPQQLAAAITPRTQALILNSPSNPIGVVYSPAEIEALMQVVIEKNITVISDEIYEDLLYEGAEHVSPGSLSDEAFKHTITVNGFSKAYSMTGWRLGYLAAPMPVTKAIIALQGHSTSAPNTFAQHGAVAALTGSQEPVREMLAAFAERRDYMYGRLAGIAGISCVKPMGAFYMLPNISSFGMDSLTFAEKLLQVQKVAVVPGQPFGADQNIRLSYACSMENIREGMDRLEAFLGVL